MTRQEQEAAGLAINGPAYEDWPNEALLEEFTQAVCSERVLGRDGGTPTAAVLMRKEVLRRMGCVRIPFEGG